MATKKRAKSKRKKVTRSTARRRTVKRSIAKRKTIKRSKVKKPKSTTTLEKKIAELESRLSKLSPEPPKPAETAPPDSGVPLHERFREIPTGNWNDQKPKVPGFTAPGNKYFATRQRLAYHPEAKKFGTWITDAPASSQKAPPPPESVPELKPKEIPPPKPS